MCYLEGVSDVLAPLLMRCRTGEDLSLIHI